MQNVIEAILFGFSAILNYKTMKRALGIGLVVTLVWSVLGYFLWDELVSLAAYFIDLVPFSMLRSNGAWILSSFLWFCLVLITFALILAFFGNMILERVSKEKYSSFSLLVVFCSAVFWSLVWMLQGSAIHTQFLKLLNWLPFETLETGLAYLLGFYFVYSGIIVTMLLVTSFFSEALLEDINEKYFPYETLLQEDEIKASENRLLDIMIYAVVSIVAFPLLFIPVLNFVLQIGLWIWLIKDTFVNDSALLVIPKEKRAKLSEYKTGFFILSGVTALFNFLPIFNIFGPFFGEIAMFYYLKEIQKEL
ncbi:EI24 domain-containing protein [Sulfurimonas sp. SWIR-19]|uniref:EI24 domain-containing protein n=1 Tax=Sulfurimonas sp. SWIR-19 TaxID=2878390 RepID=UPI001CF12BBE|nr:EI24 domain-containing protein [Sulfurimonas sp. SWIR-19]UCN00796.1 EI24 domain-containing protein [Sulfurimonas sp. SWIR-19]